MVSFCAICQEDILSLTEVVRTCEGKHVFCRTCFFDWAMLKIRKKKIALMRYFEQYDCGSLDTSDYMMYSDRVPEDTIQCPLCRGEAMSIWDCPMTGVDEYTDQKGIRHEDHYHQGQLHGISRSWWPSGQLKREYTWEMGKLHGTFRALYETGELKAEITLQNHAMVGFHKMWYKNGHMKSQWSYWEDNLHRGTYACKNGLSQDWYENGQLQLQSFWKEGKLHGIYQGWYEDGQIACEKMYHENREVGVSKFWYPNGQLKEENIYDDWIGSVISWGWNEGGQLISIRTYKGRHDCLDGASVSWNAEGVFQGKIYYVKDEVIPLCTACSRGSFEKSLCKGCNSRIRSRSSMAEPRKKQTYGRKFWNNHNR